MKGADRDVGEAPPAPLRRDGLTFSRAAAVRHLRQADAKLAALIDAAGPFTVRPEGAFEPFPYLLRTIVYQQLNGTAAATIHGRLLDLFGGEVPSPEILRQASPELLRTAGLSGSKAAAAIDLAVHAHDGLLPTADELPTLSDLELVDRMTVVRGIGPWTVHMLLIFRLGRPDVLPSGDFGVREGFRLLESLDTQPTPSDFRARTEHWRPYRSVASWYMYRAVDLHRATSLDTTAVD
ncbi:MAG: DNA-3-methyladenine glycosylase [Thermoleophilia bacterium]|nr:DNA-3-methyladenine glycosylase [Thermoleophilia bacterium]